MYMIRSLDSEKFMRFARCLRSSEKNAKNVRMCVMKWEMASDDSFLFLFSRARWRNLSACGNGMKLIWEVKHSSRKSGQAQQIHATRHQPTHICQKIKVHTGSGFGLKPKSRKSLKCWRQQFVYTTCTYACMLFIPRGCKWAIKTARETERNNVDARKIYRSLSFLGWSVETSFHVSLRQFLSPLLCSSLFEDFCRQPAAVIALERAYRKRRHLAFS